MVPGGTGRTGPVLPKISSECSSLAGTVPPSSSRARMRRTIAGSTPAGSGRVMSERQVASPGSAVRRSRTRWSLSVATSAGTTISTAGVSGSTMLDRLSRRRQIARRPRSAAVLMVPGSIGPHSAGSARASRASSASTALNVGTSAYPSGPPQASSGRWLASRYRTRPGCPASHGSRLTTRPVSYTDGVTCPHGSATRPASSSATAADTSRSTLVWSTIEAGRYRPAARRPAGVAMAQPSIEIADLLSATECGATCAVAGLTQRDLLRCAAAYPDLFPARPFDPAFFSTIASANAFCAPWLSADRLRITNRITLWVFGLDRLIDHVSTTPAEVDDIVRRCLSAAAGTPSGDPLTGFLAEVRAELAGTPSFAALHDVWYDELRRMLAAMAREWRWRMTGRLPTLDSYLDSAEFGFSVVFVLNGTATTEPEDI